MNSLERQQIHDPDTGLLLHECLRLTKDNLAKGALQRLDVSEPNEFLQGAMMAIPPNHKFRPHKHLERQRSFSNLRAQECWVVISGKVEVDYYSESGIFLQTARLEAGDLSISYRGGHGYRTLEADAIVYEFKSGPYEGQEIDKIFLD
jgi:hypothetical protein